MSKTKWLSLSTVTMIALAAPPGAHAYYAGKSASGSAGDPNKFQGSYSSSTSLTGSTSQTGHRAEARATASTWVRILGHHVSIGTFNGWVTGNDDMAGKTELGLNVVVGGRLIAQPRLSNITKRELGYSYAGPAGPTYETTVMVGPVPIAIKVGANFRIGAVVGVDAANYTASGYVRPEASVDLHGSVGVGVRFRGFSVSAGLRNDLSLVSFGLPVTASRDGELVSPPARTSSRLASTRHLISQPSTGVWLCTRKRGHSIGTTRS